MNRNLSKTGACVDHSSTSNRLIPSFVQKRSTAVNEAQIRKGSRLLLIGNQRPPRRALSANPAPLGPRVHWISRTAAVSMRALSVSSSIALRIARFDLNQTESHVVSSAHNLVAFEASCDVIWVAGCAGEIDVHPVDEQPVFELADGTLAFLVDVIEHVAGVGVVKGANHVVAGARFEHGELLADLRGSVRQHIMPQPARADVQTVVDCCTVPRSMGILALGFGYPYLT